MSAFALTVPCAAFALAVVTAPPLPAAGQDASEIRVIGVNEGPPRDWLPTPGS